MALSAKLKTALDETRTLVLGTQILLGFQYQGVFRPRFDDLPAHARISIGFALGLLLITMGLLIVPSAFHRIAARGESTGRVLHVAGRCAAAALLPFAVGLGLDLSVATERITAHAALGAAAGIGFAFLTMAGWYGMGTVMKRHHGAGARRQAESERNAHEDAPLHTRIEQMNTEARVIIPGAQALLGFQLIIVLTEIFEKLPVLSRWLHAVALLSVALSVILLMTPAALHRIVWAGEDSEDLLRIGGRIIGFALLPLALGISGDSYVVFTRIAKSAGLGAAASIAVLVWLLTAWFTWPLLMRHRLAAEHRPAGVS